MKLRRTFWRGGLFFSAALLVATAAWAETSPANNPAVGAETKAISEEEQLQMQIEAKTKEIKDLEVLAEKYRKTIAETAEQAKTLKSEIARINAAIAKLQNDIRLTEQRVQKTNLEIKSLKREIDKTGGEIESKKKSLKELIRATQYADKTTSLVLLLRQETLSDFFNELESATSIQHELFNAVRELKSLKSNLTVKKTGSESRVKDLERYSDQLQDKKILQTMTQQERGQVLSATQNEEKRYQDLLRETEKKQSALESEIRDYELKLKYNVDPATLPNARAGVLAWPLPEHADSMFQCGRSVSSYLTQCFGNTAFALGGAYNGKGHNGIDLRAETGTEVFSAEAGVVRGIGDTDMGCRGVSYGKWVLIDHDNNLTTLYAHLSMIKAAPGQRVSRGDIVGYSGRTGYVTGPHLHFSVFAERAVEIGNFTSRVCGRTMQLPLSPLNGYLDPLNYL